MKIRIGFVSILALMAASAMAQTAGSAIYEMKCVMCHGNTGTGDTPMGRNLKVPSFKSAAIRKTPEARLITVVQNGKGNMPAFKGKLMNPQIKQVVDYVIQLEK